MGARAERVDAVLLGAEIALVAVASVAGAVLNARGVPIHASAAPFIATWVPHVGPGTPLALATAGLVLAYGPRLAATLGWRALLAVGYVASVGWTFGLAMVDGWSRGIAGRLATTDEYLHDVPRVHGIGALLRGFDDHISNAAPGFWTTHVAGHPPGALLVFVGLDRAGLGGGTAAGVACVLVGAVAVPCVAVVTRVRSGPDTALAAWPFLVLFPGAVWVGASADGLFTGVVAAGIALLAVDGWWRHLLGGLLLGAALYLSYGLLLVGLLAAVVLWRRPRAAAVGAVGVAAVVLAFTAGGFWWPTGYHLVRERYHAGYGGVRPYGYWVWANLAVLVACAGPAVGPALRRAVAVRMWLPVAAGVAILAADLSGLSKGETERIWLPYAIWLLPAAGLLTRRRAWLAGQAATALLVNHLLLTHW